jgi:hypothetical protein
MNRSTPVAPVRLLLFLVLPLAFAACREAKVTSYQIPKEHVAGVQPAAAAPGAAASAAAPAPAVTVAARPVGDLAWTAPAAWKAKATSSMRRGSFDVGEGSGPLADLAITAFPGDVGGDLANVNRWRGQIDLPPITEAELAAALQPVAGGIPGIKVTHLTGGTSANPLGMLVAIVPYEGATWFFKLTGPVAIVAAEKSRFLEFLATVRPGAPGATATPPPTTAPVPMTAPMSMSSPPPAEVIAASAAIAGLRWSAPAHWESKPASALRKATFVIPGGGTPAELAVTAFPGTVGGELANVNRWRAQLQLPPIDAAALAGSVTRFTAHDLSVAVVEFTGGPNGSQRLLGAMVPHDGATWFFKLTGPDAVVAAEKTAFLSFLQSLSAP